MSKFAKFMKANKTTKENGFYAPTASLCDDDGKPLKWEFRHVSSKENEALREECTSRSPLGERGLKSPRRSLWRRRSMVAPR